MLWSIPTPTIIKTKLLPPELKKGKGRPVIGNIPILTPALTKTWEKIKTAMPTENNFAKLGVAVKPVIKIL